MGEITKIKVNGDPESSYQLYPRNEEFAKRSEGVQPDWNQNDDTQPDYVKNRPFYTGDPKENILFNGPFVFTIIGMGPIGERGVYNGVTDFSPEIGQTYQVSWDGAVYSCVGTEYNSLIALGNLSIMNFGSDTGEPFLMTFGPGSINIYTHPVGSSHTISIGKMLAPVVKIDPKYLPMPIPFKPVDKSYLTFSSPYIFTLKVNDATKHWDGILEYFASDKTWSTWDGTSALSAVYNDGEYVLYLRGTGNTVITGDSYDYGWVFTGSDISCIGNIESLLDYATVTYGGHPTMAKYCYSGMFSGCTALTRAPALPATTLAMECYSGMFSGCTSLTQAPALPAITLSLYCYASMFRYCTALTHAPTLPATTLAGSCYRYMFYGCTALIQAPALPATTMENSCYSSMFYGCTALTQAPALPATKLATDCYSDMFSGCTSLTQAPALPATKLATNCYSNMFRDCTSLKLSSTQTGEYTVTYCIPMSGTGTTATSALNNMFASTGGTFTGTPAINTTYYLSSGNMIVRETEIATLNGYVGSMIDVAIDEYADTAEYIIPSSTSGSTKKFKITVDDSGALTATEVT